MDDDAAFRELLARLAHKLEEMLLVRMHSFILKQTIQLPSEAGKYNLSLYLPDPEPTLKDNSRFAIQLANKGVWDEKTGFNNLKTLTVE